LVLAEEDNDFHLVVGRDPAKSERYMTVELSGLPPESSPHFGRLNEARDPILSSSAMVSPAHHMTSTTPRSRSRSKAPCSST
jgi:hypothetical protein